MGIWLLVIITSYFFFSLAFFGDKMMLTGKANATLYAFYVGILSALVVVFIPFIKFGFPPGPSIPWILADGLVYVLGVYVMFLALEKFEVSRVMPTIGALQPVLILLLTWLMWGPQLVTGWNVVAFVLLVLGSVLISLEKKLAITTGYVGLLFFAALLFALDYVFTKKVFLYEPFLQGLIWMRLAGFCVALLFLFSKKLRAQVFPSLSPHKHQKNPMTHTKTGVLFLATQSAGAAAGLLQSFSISLVPVSFLAIINSLRGTQYVFLFLITLFFSRFFPKIFKEDISKKVVIQKVISIGIIVAGLVILVSN